HLVDAGGLVPAAGRQEGRRGPGGGLGADDLDALRRHGPHHLLHHRDGGPQSDGLILRRRGSIRAAGGAQSCVGDAVGEEVIPSSTDSRPTCSSMGITVRSKVMSDPPTVPTEIESYAVSALVSGSK